MSIMKNCLICQREIFRSNHSGTIKRRRGKNQVTCCRQCSKIYIRCLRYIQSVRRNERDKEKRKLIKNS